MCHVTCKVHMMVTQMWGGVGGIIVFTGESPPAQVWLYDWQHSKQWVIWIHKDLQMSYNYSFNT